MTKNPVHPFPTKKIHIQSLTSNEFVENLQLAGEKKEKRRKKEK